MELAKIGLSICFVAILLTQGETRRICGIEIEYRGFDPLEALRLVQERQIQEFTQFNRLLRRLKFKLQSEDYFAWKRCQTEFSNAKLRFIQTALKIKTSFQAQMTNLMARNLPADQYQMELQNLMQQFQSEFTPTVESFKSNIKNLFDTIQDEKRRRQWWSTVKTTQVTTGPNGSQTRTSITQTNSGIGDKLTGFSRKETSETNRASGGLLGGASSVVSKTSSSMKTKIGTTVSGGSSGQYNSGSGYGSSDNSDGNDDSNNNGNNGYSGDDNNNRNGGDDGDNQQSSGYGSSQESQSGGSYGSSGSTYESQQRKLEVEESSSSGQSGYSVGAATKEVKKEASSSTYVGQKSSGSFSDNNQINFAQTQSRTGLKETYGGYSGSESESEGGYRRRRRTLGLLSGVLASKRSAMSGDGYGGGYGSGGGGASAGVSVGVGVNAGGSGGGSRGGLGVGVGVGVGGGSGRGNGGLGVGARVGLGGSGGQGGYAGGSNGIQGGSGGFQGGSGGFQGGSDGYSVQGGSQYNSGSSFQGQYDSNSMGGYGGQSSSNFESQQSQVRSGGYAAEVKKEKYSESSVSMGSDGYGY